MVLNSETKPKAVSVEKAKSTTKPVPALEAKPSAKPVVKKVVPTESKKPDVVPAPKLVPSPVESKVKPVTMPSLEVDPKNLKSETKPKIAQPVPLTSPKPEKTDKSVKKTYDKN